MAAVTPFAIIFGGVLAIALVFSSLWQPIALRSERVASRLAVDLDVAGIRINPQQLGFLLLAVGVAAWLLALIVVSPDPTLSILLLVALVVLSFLVGRQYVFWRRKQRIAKFQDQLEGVLRSLAGGLRVGLGIRQALIMVSEQNQEPVRAEFMRVVGLNNLGMSILDAFDQLALRMRTPETSMLVRVIRVQSHTGGNLASVLDNLAGTIRARRRLRRRIRAITSQGRATGWLLGLLPLAVGAFVVLTQPSLRDAMFQTTIGKVLLGVALGLDAMAVICLFRLTRIET